jgi:hypothetical protein
MAAINGSNTGAVIAAIFKPLQAVKNRLGYIARADNADNAAHN